MVEEVFIEIPQGKLRGKKEESLLGCSYYGFQQIPYAKAPVGELRFKAPVPAEGWSGIRDATQTGPVCPSPNFFTQEYLKECDEDSLHLNVYVKTLPQQLGGKKLPVLVWIHGGGFTVGSGNKEAYGPDFLLEHNVALVSINYRLGPLGFLSLQTPQCPGNFGLKDQRLALKWVKNNIARFGGDPENITIFGESAGAASVHFHVISPGSRGLFHRAISQSGTALGQWAIATSPREAAFKLGKRLGCDTDDDAVLLDFLRKAPAKDLIEKQHGILKEIEGDILGEEFLNFSFSPVVEPENEDAIITKHPNQLVDGETADVPFILGITSKEMIMAIKGIDTLPKCTRLEDFQAFIPKRLNLKKDSEVSLEAAKRIRDFYFKNGISMDNFIDALSDTFFNYAVYKTIRSRLTNKKIKSPTYAYIFSYDGNRAIIKIMVGQPHLKGTSHGDDLAYLFHAHFPEIQGEIAKPEGADLETIHRFCKLWVNFATTGAPTNDQSEVNWSPIELNKEVYLDFGDKLEIKKGFLTERMKLWDGIFQLVEEKS